LASGYALWTYASGEWATEVATAPQDANIKSAPAGAKLAALTPPATLPPGTSSLLAIEVARIDAGGSSVLAGRSPPNHKVTLLANGREIATVTATDEGQWAAVVDEGIDAGPLELSIVSQPKEGGATVRGAPRQLVVPAAPASALAAAQSRSVPAQSAAVDNKGTSPRAAAQSIDRPGGQAQVKSGMPAPAQAPTQAKSDEAASKRALAEFEALVERTRKEMAQQPATSPVKAESNRGATVLAAGPPPTPMQVPASAAPAAPETRLAAAAPPAVSPSVARTERAPAAIQAPIPVPITFVSNQVALTSDGERAASLLAEYLRLKQPAGITLSGHADARGPDGYNMRLSLRRLEIIERYLRAAGYSGQLSLLPRGKREPYAGIDRKRLPLREIYQADRRVELRLTP
jgi:outer membrane protein OmpA-like peptidoglycan-associated protein